MTNSLTLDQFLNSAFSNRVAGIEAVEKFSSDKIVFDKRDIGATPKKIIALDVCPGYWWFVENPDKPGKSKPVFGLLPPKHKVNYAKTQYGAGTPEPLLVCSVIDLSLDQPALRIFQTNQKGFINGFTKAIKTLKEAGKALHMVDLKLVKEETANNPNYAVVIDLASVSMNDATAKARGEQIISIVTTTFDEWGIDLKSGLDLTRWFTGNGLGGVIPRFAKEGNDEVDYTSDEAPPEATPETTPEATLTQAISTIDTPSQSTATIASPATDYMEVLRNISKASGDVIEMPTVRKFMKVNNLKKLSSVEELYIVIDGVAKEVLKDLVPVDHLDSAIRETDWLSDTAWSEFQKLLKEDEKKPKQTNPTTRLNPSQPSVTKWGIDMVIDPGEALKLYNSHEISKLTIESDEFAVELQSFILECLACHPKASGTLGSELIEFVSTYDADTLPLMTWDELLAEFVSNAGDMMKGTALQADLGSFSLEEF